MANLLILFLLLPFPLLLLLANSPIAHTMVIQVPSADQANKMARQMVEGAVAALKQKYRLDRSRLKVGHADEETTHQKDASGGVNGHKRRRKKKHGHGHGHMTTGTGGGVAAALKYGDEEEMRRTKDRGKQLIEALGVVHGGRADDETVAAEKRMPMTMKSLFGKFTRRD